ncbi:efflux RND transporter periplasmic adaptor subunit [Sphingomonas bacterium]|uniref:efflux RND transporter periplasmic adaptor subunit n=1 Tax=Sphingomonas bacterium TaxID=1895847 RepID=UPI001575AF04|nr:efflux RND transporter periplasmic adaptor subunit [Sphingomonas bacterium]
MTTSTATPLPPARTLDRRRQLRLIGIAALVMLGLWLLVAAVRHLAAAPAPAEATLPAGTFRATPEQLTTMKVEAVRSGEAAGLVQATGTISVDEERSTPVLLPFSGQVAEVLVAAGQSVAKGQPLLRLASADYNNARNALAGAQAQQQTAQAQLKIARDNAARQEAVYRTAGGALKDYRQAQSDLVAAQGQAATAASAAATARGQLALLGGTQTSATLASYLSPVSGIVVARNVAPGQYVGAGGDKPLMTVADLSSVWLIAQLPESDAAAVKVGDPVTVTTPAYPGRSFRATIDNVGAALDPATHRLPVRASVANPGAALKPQMFASFAIQRIAPAGRGSASGILVPSQAVVHEGDGARVWLSLGNGLLRAQAVTVSDSADGTDTVTAGLKPGDRIVTAGALFVNQAGLGG